MEKARAIWDLFKIHFRLVYCSFMGRDEKYSLQSTKKKMYRSTVDVNHKNDKMQFWILKNLKLSYFSKFWVFEVFLNENLKQVFMPKGDPANSTTKIQTF